MSAFLNYLFFFNRSVNFFFLKNVSKKIINFFLDTINHIFKFLHKIKPLKTCSDFFFSKFEKVVFTFFDSYYFSRFIFFCEFLFVMFIFIGYCFVMLFSFIYDSFDRNYYFFKAYFSNFKFRDFFFKKTYISIYTDLKYYFNDIKHSFDELEDVYKKKLCIFFYL